MKRIYYPMLLLVAVFLFNLVGSAQVKAPRIIKIDRTPIITALDSSAFSVQRLTLMDFGRNLQLEFSITNRSGQNSGGIKFSITGYSKSGDVLSQTTWARADEIPVDAKLLTLIDLNPNMKGADYYTAEFISRSALNRIEGEYAENCEGCGQIALNLCGSRGTSSFNCVGTPYKCEFTCNPPPMGERVTAKK